MEQTVKLGLSKSIGVSNFNEEQLERLLKNSTIKPVINQFEVRYYRNIKENTSIILPGVYKVLSNDFSERKY